MEKYMKNPLSAALFAAFVTMLAVYFKHTSSATEKEKQLPNSAYTKPALFVGVLVYFIVYMGNGQYETISKEPF
jgi:uncharacterized membrane protein YphA (DoxX/SURF4 family)